MRLSAQHSLQDIDDKSNTPGARVNFEAARLSEFDTKQGGRYSDSGRYTTTHVIYRRDWAWMQAFGLDAILPSV